ncbi:MAG: hypothetical protein EZS28_003934 [Streblomastix strix]|uniref:Intimal thickness related receptor IRP domain-containing protein n=1 Tax=Streblomastix strix TaxID=222440 RepID=A0A5J4X076_9EUKA|nr:MAG: hypothetical protein EZS28_003934 [Streblomastix strix]
MLAQLIILTICANALKIGGERFDIENLTLSGDIYYEVEAKSEFTELGRDVLLFNVFAPLSANVTGSCNQTNLSAIAYLNGDLDNCYPVAQYSESVKPVLLQNGQGFSLAYKLQGTQQSLDIIFSCNKIQNLSAYFNQSYHYTINWLHPQACPTSKQLSVGWIFLIVIGSIIALYFLVGIPINVFLLKKRGIQVLPFFGYISNLFEIIKDGALFLISPCIPKKSQYQIFEDTTL